jgi:hypothetical protein
MREAVYTIKAEGFEGSIKFEKPSFSQRMKYVADCNFETGAEGNIQMSAKNAESISKMVDHVEKHIKEVNVKHVASETTAVSYEDLCYDNIFDSVLIEVAGVIMSGANLGGMRGQK